MNKEPKLHVLGTGYIADLGPALTPDNREIVWSGSIGLSKRLDEEPELREKYQKLFDNPQLLEEYFVECDPDASDQCIDGRRKHGYTPAETSKIARGPKVPGGTPAAALAYRLVENPLGLNGETISDDLAHVLEMYEANGLFVGAHIDDHQQPGFTGCGAIDKMPTILRKFSEFESTWTMRFLVNAMLGDKYEPEILDSLIGRLIGLQGMKDTYLQRNSQGKYDYRENVIKIIRETAEEEGPVEKLVGKHNEVGLVINTIDNTTFDRDRLSHETDDKLQLFNYDLWRTLEIAETLYSTQDDLSVDAQREIIHKRKQFMTAGAMYAVATAMVLTDGSIKVLVRN